MTNDPKPTVTSHDFAQLLGVSSRKIADWCSAGRLPGVKFGKVWLIPRHEYDRVAKIMQPPEVSAAA